MAAVQAAGPVALFHAARMYWIGRLVRFSALGAADDAAAPFLRTEAFPTTPCSPINRRARQSCAPPWFIARAASAELFAALSGLPIQVRIGGSMVRPIQVGHLAAGIILSWRPTPPLPHPSKQSVSRKTPRRLSQGFPSLARSAAGSRHSRAGSSAALLGRVGGLFSPGLSRRIRCACSTSRDRRPRAFRDSPRAQARVGARGSGARAGDPADDDKLSLFPAPLR